MEPDESASEYRAAPSSAKLSKTPSWVMLGFLLGAAFVAALPSPRKSEEPVEPPALTPPPTRPAESREPAPLTTIEAVFAEWGRFAVWSDDTTEVTLWNTRERAFTDCYEVRRIGEVFYFRSIPTLSRRVLTHGRIEPSSPLQFTETEAQYREWLEFGRTERPAAAPPRPKVPPPRPVKVPATPVTVIDPTIAVSPGDNLKFEGAPPAPAVVK